MDFIHRVVHAPCVRSISERIQALSKSHSERLRPLKCKSGAILLLGSAIFFGNLAHRISRSEALHDWERSHPPSLRVWEHALGARGYRLWDAHKNPELLKSLLRSLPTLLNETGATSITADGQWVAFELPGSDLSSATRFYCLNCSSKLTNSQKWSSFGFSWEGFELVLNHMDALLVDRPSSLAKEKTPHWVDVREIRY